MRLFDRIWANKIKEGDPISFETFIKKHKNMVFNYSLRLIGDYQIAEEITQDVFFKAYQKIDQYDAAQSSLATWLMAIAHNLSVNALRTKKSALPLQDQCLAITSEQNPEKQALVSETIDNLLNALDTLSEKEKSILLLKDYSGYKTKEISQMLNFPEGTVKSALHGARLKIRERLGESYD